MFEFFRGKFNWIISFPTISGIVVAQNRALENNFRFQQQFSYFGGGGERSRVPPVVPPSKLNEFF